MPLASATRLQAERPARRRRMFVACIGIAASLSGAAEAWAADACSARSGAERVSVVELYTSEGCNSCPPADRWLSAQHDDSRTLALAFHVDYWDRLGWVDRFASPAYTARQYQVQHTSGAKFVYTPQVLRDGADWPGWSGGPGSVPSVPAPVHLDLQREGAQVVAQVMPIAGAALPAKLSAYWAVVEDGHVSDVKSGENSGVTLHHDHVVRRYVPVAAWTATQPQQLRLDLPLPTPDDARHARRVVLVVTDPATGRTTQAIETAAGGC